MNYKLPPWLSSTQPVQMPPGLSSTQPVMMPQRRPADLGMAPMPVNPGMPFVPGRTPPNPMPVKPPNPMPVNPGMPFVPPNMPRMPKMMTPFNLLSGR